MRKPKNLIEALRPFFDPKEKEQGHVDTAARARVFHLKRGRELLLSPEGKGYHVTILTGRGESFGDGPFYDTGPSAAELRGFVDA